MRAPGLDRRFIVCRATLRLVLAKRLGRQPETIHFRYSAAGKPELTDLEANQVHFNVTHSGDWAKIAICEGLPVGIDVERIRPDFATMAIAERFFSIAERIALRSVPEDLRPISFFRCWTRKEAFIKAVGTGIAFPLDDFDVALAPNAPAALLSIRGNIAEAQRWSMRDLPADPGFVAALAIAERNITILAGEQVS
jgi:4'-phosphopantetheinyl transferase